jgi:putative oxidoreductase
MSPLVTLGRILFVVLFVFSGASKFADIAGTAQAITDKVIPTLPAALTVYTTQLETMSGMPLAQILAIASGAVEVVCGLLIALNFGAPLFAIVLILFVCVATFYFHDFWNMTGADKINNMVHALKNLSLIGGLLMIAGYRKPVLEDSNYTGTVETRY